MSDKLLKTPLFHFHTEAGAKMAPFAGYSMPIQYTSILEEHVWTRTETGLFDVSHMGQILVTGEKSGEELDNLFPTKVSSLKTGKCAYTVLSNETGGIIDDLIITKRDENSYFLVLNASRKEIDIPWIRSKLPSSHVTVMDDHALIAIQGPTAERTLHGLGVHDIKTLPFMHGMADEVCGIPVYITRTGYTGEDGFEISVHNSHTLKLWQEFLHTSYVKPVGLGARDSLRLEAGFPLYGQDMDEHTSPIEANLKWIISKDHTRFIGAEHILNLDSHSENIKKRIGIELLDKGIARHGAPILNDAGVVIGQVCSGGYSPSLQKGIAQGYIPAPYCEVKTPLFVDVRGRKIAAQVHKLAFMPNNTKRSTN